MVYSYFEFEETLQILGLSRGERKELLNSQIARENKHFELQIWRLPLSLEISEHLDSFFTRN